MIKTTKLITIDSFLSAEEKLFAGSGGNFTALMHDLIYAIRIIARDVRRAGINNLLGLTSDINASGDMVRKLDSYTNEIIINIMRKNPNVCCMASEENPGMIDTGNDEGKYILLFDPLDGSTNIDVNITVGTIFALYKRTGKYTPPTQADILQPGYKLVAAGYALYGSATILTFTTGRGVNTFTYEPSVGEFLLTFENMKIPDHGHSFSCNMANYRKWPDSIRKFVDDMQTDKNFTFRYVATVVADVHRILHYGGIYMYPQEPAKPDGKIRLTYEANPLSFIVEQAGGMASTGTQPILQVEPENIHQSVPFFIGSPGNMTQLHKYTSG